MKTNSVIIKVGCTLLFISLFFYIAYHKTFLVSDQPRNLLQALCSEYANLRHHGIRIPIYLTEFLTILFRSFFPDIYWGSLFYLGSFFILYFIPTIIVLKYCWKRVESLYLYFLFIFSFLFYGYVGVAPEFVIASHLFISITLLMPSLVKPHDNTTIKKIISIMTIFLAFSHPFSIVFVILTIVFYLALILSRKELPSKMVLVTLSISIGVATIGMISDSSDLDKIKVFFESHSEASHFVFFNSNNLPIYFQIILSSVILSLAIFCNHLRKYLFALLSIPIILLSHSFFNIVDKKLFYYYITDFHHRSYLIPILCWAFLFIILQIKKATSEPTRTDQISFIIGLFIVLTFNLTNLSIRKKQFLNVLSDIIQTNQKEIHLRHIPSPYPPDPELLFIIRWTFKESINTKLIDSYGAEIGKYNSINESNSPKGCQEW